MSNEKNDHETDKFFAWLKSRIHLPEDTSVKVPPLTPKMLDQAWESAQAHRRYQLKYGSYEEHLLPLAASDGVLHNGPVRIDNPGGEWSLTREEILGDPESQILKFRCRADLVPDLQGREINVQIGAEIYALGPINRRGVAEVEVPRGIDMAQAIDVRIQKRKNPTNDPV